MHGTRGFAAVALSVVVLLGTGVPAEGQQTGPLDVFDFYIGTLVPRDVGDGPLDSRVELSWSVGRQAVGFLGHWSQPDVPGEFVDGLIGWDPINQQITISGVFYHGAFFSGTVRILDRERHVVRREWEGRYPDGRRIPYRETWTPVSDDEFEWHIEYLADGIWKSDRAPGLDGPAIHRVVRSSLAESGADSSAPELPFDPPAPHPLLERLGALEGSLSSCSRQLDEHGRVVTARRFEVLIQRRVFDQVVSVDFVGSDHDVRWSPQSSMLMYDRKNDRLEDRTVSAIGSVERWDEVEPWDGDVIAFQLREKATFVLGDDPAQPLDFRKAYSSIEDDGYDLAYHISADDGKSWRPLFRETAKTASRELECSPEEAEQ